MNLTYNFVESGIIFSITGALDLEKIKFSSKDFSKQSEAFNFVSDYIDQFKSSPKKEVLLEKFPDLEVSSAGNNLDFLLNEFEKQVIFRKTKAVIQDLQEDLKVNPKLTLPKLISHLDDIGIKYDKEVVVYDEGTLSRFEDYEKRKELRKVGLGIIGIPTPLKTINRSGVGWLPGQVTSVFARPTVGKTWFSIKTAMVAMKYSRRVLFISTEMPADQINMRADIVYGHMLGYKFSHKKLKRGDLTQEEENQYKKFLSESSTKRLFVCDHVDEDSLSIPVISKLVKKHYPDLLIIDGMYLISGDKSVREGWRQDHKIFQEIKNLCLGRNISAFVSTQATRDAGNDLFTPPTAIQVANGDALIRASDVAFSMCIRDETTSDRLVQFQKWRDDELPAQYAVLKWDVDCGDIEELDVKVGVQQKKKSIDNKEEDLF